MQLEEIIIEIEKIAPLAAASDWDNSGMQVAANRKTVDVLAVCLDPTPASISEALNRNAQCILCHHPLALKPALPCRPDAYHEVLRLLFAADVPLYAAHTSLDANPAGPAGWLAKELKLANTAVLDPVPCLPENSNQPLGAGLAGDLPSPMGVRDITRLLSRHIDLSTATICGHAPDGIGRMAYCTGSGSSLLAEAVAAGAKLFITGDVKYHTALSTEICLLDVGHHSLEEEMMRRMSRMLSERLKGLTVCFVPSVSPLRPLPLISKEVSNDQRHLF
jgi:dinuclear metal center YbgI/SA1388 family protein